LVYSKQIDDEEKEKHELAGTMIRLMSISEAKDEIDKKYALKIITSKKVRYMVGTILLLKI
jgi:hypothetical protein